MLIGMLTVYAVFVATVVALGMSAGLAYIYAHGIGAALRGAARYGCAAVAWAALGTAAALLALYRLACGGAAFVAVLALLTLARLLSAWQERRAA